jgi:hypothetical protein
MKERIKMIRSVYKKTDFLYIMISKMYYRQIYVCEGVHHTFYGQNIVRSENPGLYEVAKMLLEKHSALQSPTFFKFDNDIFTIFFEICILDNNETLLHKAHSI